MDLSEIAQKKEVLKCPMEEAIPSLPMDGMTYGHTRIREVNISLEIQMLINKMTSEPWEKLPLTNQSTENGSFHMKEVTGSMVQLPLGEDKWLETPFD